MRQIKKGQKLYIVVATHFMSGYEEQDKKIAFISRESLNMDDPNVYMVEVEVTKILK